MLSYFVFARRAHERRLTGVGAGDRLRPNVMQCVSGFQAYTNEAFRILNNSIEMGYIMSDFLKNFPLSRRSVLSLIGAASCALVIPANAYAEANGVDASSQGCTVLPASENSKDLLSIIDSNGEIANITIIDEQEKRTVLLVYPNSSEMFAFELDKNTGTLAILETGEVVPYSLETEELPVLTRLNEPARTYERFNFSWRSIKNATGGIAVAGPIISVILAAIGVVSGTSALVNGVNAALAAVGYVIPDDPNHGIYVIMVMKRWYENGKLVKAEYDFDEVGTY